jgi:hypothetical protein
MSLSFICFVIAAVIFFLIGVKVDIGTLARWDFIGLFLVALGLALGGYPVLDRPWTRP